MSNNNNWKRIGGYSRTGTQNFVRTNDGAMGGTTFGPTDVSYNTGNLTQRIGNNAGVMFVNGDIDMTGGPGVGAPINRVRNVRDPIENQDVATKYYVDKTIAGIPQLQLSVGPIGPQGPPGIGDAGQNGSDGSTGPTGVTGPVGPRGATEGVVGPTGVNGAIGATGANGVAGSTGAIGPVGAQGIQGIQGNQGIQGSNGTILWLNPDGDSINNELITDSYMLSQVPIQSSLRTIGPISVSSTYGNANKMIPGSRFWNSALKISTLSVVPSGVWSLNLYAAVPSNSDANQVSIYAAIFMITGTQNQPSPDSLIIETKDGGDAGYYPPRAAYLPDHVKYIGRSWEAAGVATNTQNVLTTRTTGVPITSTAKNLYKLQMPVDFVTLKDASGNSEHVYLQLQIYIKNTLESSQTANVLLYYQTNLSTSETTYSYLQTTFGAVGSIGPEGKTGPFGLPGAEGSKGPTGNNGQIGAIGPTGTTGARGPTGPQGTTGPTGPAGQSNSFGPQYSVQYRSNAAPLGVNDPNGSFGGTTNFRYVASGYSTNASDASAGTVVTNDLACKSIHSSFYVEDPSITGSNTRPRTFVKGGEGGGGYVVLASGKNTVDGGTTNSPETASDITHGIKLIHNFDASPPVATINIHNNNKLSGKVGIKFDLTTGDVTAATDKFCVLNSSGRAGIGGISAGEMSAVGQSGLDRALHVCGNVMVGTHPGIPRTITASSAMIMLNEPTSEPTTKVYPGMYHRGVLGTTSSTLGLQDSSGGLGITAPNFITFQTGNGTTQSNSIIIDVSGMVSMTGRTNLNGSVSVGQNFADTSSHSSIKSILDISGTTHMSSVTRSNIDNPRLKLISNALNPESDIPSLSQSANEINGVSFTENSTGFLRLSAQTPANSCIDLIGLNNHITGRRYNNSVRISTGGVERMIIDGTGNIGIGIGTNTPGVRLDVAGAASVAAARITSTATTGIAITTTGRVGVNNAAPTVPLDVTGAAKISGNLDMSSTGRINNLVNPTSNQDAATKVYVDTITADIASITATNTAITNALNNGSMTNNPTIIENGTAATINRLVFTPTTINGRATLNNDADLYYQPNINTLYAGNVGVAGNVGIATVSPSAPLEVTGNAILRNSVRVGSSVAPTVALDVTGDVKVSSTLTTVGNVGIATVSPSAPLDVTGNALLRNLVRVGSNVAPTVALDVTGDVKVSSTLTTVGNVGIATASPTAPLDVTGNAILRDSVRVGSNVAPTVALDVTGAVKVSSTLTTVGNVGIGTVSPTAPLDVTGAAKISTVVSAGTGVIIGDNTQSTMTTDSGLDIRSSTTARIRFIGATKRFTLGTNGTESFVLNEDAHDMAFGTNGTQRMKIKADGKIGIGTNTPGAELEVVGRIYANNSASSNNAIVTTGRVGINTMTPTVPLDVTGEARITGNLDMNLSGRITNLVNPTDLQDAATKAYVIGQDWTNVPTIFREDYNSNNIYITGSAVTPSNGYYARGPLFMDGDFYYNPSLNALHASNFYGTNFYGTATNARNAQENAPFRIGQNLTEESIYLNNGGYPYSNYGNKIALVVKKLSETVKKRPYYRITQSILSTGVDGNGSLGSMALPYNNDGELTYGLHPYGGFPVAFFEGGIQLDYVIYGSDKRIKQNITEITDGTSSLQLLRRIKSSTFEYVDKIRHSPYKVHGFIAQDIKDIVPEAVQLVPDCLPSFYCMCSIEKYSIQENDKTETFRLYIPVNDVKKLIFTGNHDEKTGIEYKTVTGGPASDVSGNQNFKVKLKDSSDKDVEVMTTRIIDDFSFLVKVPLNDKGGNDIIKEDSYFLYGQYVDDFHKLETEHIHNIAISALKEVDRQQQADKARITELEKNVSHLEAKVAEQQSIINDILERLNKAGL